MKTIYTVLLLVVILSLLSGCAGNTEGEALEISEVHGKYLGFDNDGIVLVEIDEEIVSFVLSDDLQFQFEETIMEGEHLLISYIEDEQGQFLIQTVDAEECCPLCH